MAKEAKARIKINKLLESSGWRFFDNEEGNANILLESNTTIQGVNKDRLQTIKIPIPPLDIQQIISEKIDNEQQIVNSNKELIAIFDGYEIRRHYDEENETWYFSVIDVMHVLLQNAEY